MKRVIFIVACLLLLAATAAGQNATGVNTGRGPRYDTNFWNWPSGTGVRWIDAVERMLGLSNAVGTGTIYYVDSGVTTEGNGSSWDHAVNTLAEAVAKCTTSAGDRIYVAEGHAENLSSATIFKISTAGVTVIGMGSGTLMPTFTTTATAGVAHLNAANVRVYNCRFLCGITNTTTLGKITGDDCGFIGCYWGEGGDDGDMNGITVITVGAADGDSDRALLLGNEIRCPTSGSWTQGIKLNKDMSGIRVIGNHVYGDWTSGAAIEGQASSNAQVDCVIEDNDLYQTDTGEPVIEILDTSSTGIIANNRCFSDTDGTTIDYGGLLDGGGNTWNVTATTTNLGAAPAGLMIDSVNNLLGYDDNDNLASTSSVASNRDGSILERLEFIAKYLETGTPGALVAPASTFSILDILGTDGSTTTGAVAGSILGAIGTNEAIADTAFTSATVTADKDGSVLERQESIQLAALPSANHPNYFVVTADMTSATWNTTAFHEIVTVTGACRVTIMVEVVATIITTSTDGTLALGFAGNTSGIFSATALDTAVTGDVFSAVYGSAATTIIGAEASGSLTHALLDVVSLNGVDIGYTIATHAATTGSLKFHVWWTPLDATGLCAAGAGGPA
jgi:hypothetical protein